MEMTILYLAILPMYSDFILEQHHWKNILDCNRVSTCTFSILCMIIKKLSYSLGKQWYIIFNTKTIELPKFLCRRPALIQLFIQQKCTKLARITAFDCNKHRQNGCEAVDTNKMTPPNDGRIWDGETIIKTIEATVLPQPAFRLCFAAYASEFQNETEEHRTYVALYSYPVVCLCLRCLAVALHKLMSPYVLIPSTLSSSSLLLPWLSAYLWRPQGVVVEFVQGTRSI